MLDELGLSCVHGKSLPSDCFREYLHNNAAQRSPMTAFVCTGWEVHACMHAWLSAANLHRGDGMRSESSGCTTGERSLAATTAGLTRSSLAADRSMTFGLL